MTSTPLPADLIKKTRDWAWWEFPFGEWHPTSEIETFIREELGYTGGTPKQYAARFIARGVENRDFEKRPNGREWRWIVYPPNPLGIPDDAPNPWLEVHPDTQGEPDADPEA